MDYIKQNRIMGWSIILLVLLNGLALGTLWWTRLGPSDQGAMRRFGPRSGGRQGMGRGQEIPPDVVDFIERELNFDSEQTQALRTMRRQFFQDSFQLRESIHTMKRSMMQAVFALDADASGIDEMANEIGQLHARLEKVQSSHLGQIRSLCKPEQKGQFMTLLDDILKMTRPEAPGSPGGGPPMRGGRRGPMGGFPRGPGTPPENGS